MKSVPKKSRSDRWEGFVKRKSFFSFAALVLFVGLFMLVLLCVLCCYCLSVNDVLYKVQSLE